MENAMIPQAVNDKIKVFNFFGFLLFGGLAVIFLYYKILGGVGFAISTGFFDLVPGGISLVLCLFAFALAYVVKVKKLNGTKVMSAVLGLLLLAFVFNQCIIWLSRIEEGLFVEGAVLKTLSDDDIIYFALYYFITAFQMLFAMVLAMFYIGLTVKGEEIDGFLNKKVLFRIMKPLLFSMLCVFVFYHLWN